MRSSPLLAALGGWLAIALVEAAALAAQVQTPGGAMLPDSAALREAAEKAQADFERERVRRLPWTHSRPPQPCDEIVGRFCFWHDGGGWEPAPEAAQVAFARERLLDRLAEIGRALPADEWIVGQRVRYLVEAESPDLAAAVAGRCAARSWWCRALEAYALHWAGDYLASEQAFDRALRAMPADQRRRWSDLDLVLDGDLRRIWRGLGPDARAAFARRLWWLADPMWSVPGNERRTEHFARQVVDRMLADARTPYEIRWGADLAELTIRYGWPMGWERTRPSLAALGGDTRPSVVGHDPPGGRPFLPSREAFLAPFDTEADDWPLDPREPRSAYAPAYADSITNLAHQLAVFQRGEIAVVVAGYDLEANGEATDAADGWPAAAIESGLRAALVVSAGPDDPPAIARAATPRGALWIEVPWRGAVVSVEAMADRRAARARYGLPLTNARPGASDLLLLARSAPLPASLDDAVRQARTSSRVTPGERLGVYFELYPPDGPGGAADVAIALRDERTGFWRGLGAALGIVRSEIGDVAMAWSEPITPGARVHPRGLALELPHLPAGSYVLALDVAFPDGSAHRSERRIEIP